MNSRDIYVVAASRTAIGTFGGSLKDEPVHKLATVAIKASLEKASLPPQCVEHVVMGNVIPTGPEDAYLARLASINAGVAIATPAFNVNRLCGSGLQAIISAAQAIMLDDVDVAVAGGAESMSRGPYMLSQMRWGARLADKPTVDFMNGVLHDPWKHNHMGITAENIAKKYGISREQQDELAFTSQQRAAAAIEQGYFASQIAPYEITSCRGTVVFSEDEHVRKQISLEQLSKMKPVFLPEEGTVTAGNASGLNDGAAAVVLASENAVSQNQLTPMARLVSYAHAGVDPDYMGMGPVPAVKTALKRAGLSTADIDIIESNEAFAAQAYAVMTELELDPEKVNPNGSGISLGHPVGATGAIITTKALHELHRTQGRYALVTMCIGGGQGIAAIFERV